MHHRNDEPEVLCAVLWCFLQVSAARDAIGDADFFLVARTDARGANAKYGLEVRPLKERAALIRLDINNHPVLRASLCVTVSHSRATQLTHVPVHRGLKPPFLQMFDIICRLHGKHII